ncbi:MAG: cyclic nucleotide-binding domain-containing protein [Nitrosomonadales bacterium]|nr:cyclic nucleotide-binding domain-containing protein [Nitrosomonadales bacterium]
MSGTEDINDAIQASLDSFTKRFAEVASDQFNEMRLCSFFAPIPGDCLEQIAMVSEIRTFAAGGRITAEGDRMNSFYVLMYGSATAYVNGCCVGTIRSGECMGEGAFFSHENFVRSATVIADGEVIALEIRKTVVDQMTGSIRGWMDKALLLALFRKLQSANQKIEQLLQDQSSSSSPD